MVIFTNSEGETLLEKYGNCILQELVKYGKMMSSKNESGVTENHGI